MDDKVATFMAITAVDNTQTAESFIEMAGGDVETAVSLYFEHGTGNLNNNNNNNNNSNSNNITNSNIITSNIDQDTEYANQLQQEIYNNETNESNIRAPIQPTHDTLLPQDLDYGMPGLTYNAPAGGMFGNAQSSVFNQNRIISLDSDDSDDSYDSNDSNYYENKRLNDMNSTQKRLATIFRPPWDIIKKLDLDSAKNEANLNNKWVLVNIQDVTDFRCQCLNRDLWSSQQVKQFIKKYFVFVQYQNDSPSGIMYKNLYSFDEFPHIAILDPVTGERMKIWSENPTVDKFIDEASDFLASHDNGINKYDDSIISVDPFSNDEDEDDEDEDEDDIEEGVDDDSFNTEEKITQPQPDSNSTTATTIPKELTYTDKILALKDPEPSNSTEKTTRVQIRSVSDNKRVVCTFHVNDPIRLLFSEVKKQFKDTLNGQPFILKMQMQKFDLQELFMTNPDETIQNAGLNNASILLEPFDE